MTVDPLHDRTGERMLVVRLAHARSDFAAAGDLWHDALVARTGTDEIPDGQRERVRAFADDPDAFLVIACDVDATVGMAVGIPARSDRGAGPVIPGRIHLTTVAVAPDRWGEGIGRAVVADVLEEARRRGYTEAQLWTFATNARAIKLYEALGFERSGETQLSASGKLNLHFQRSL